MNHFVLEEEEDLTKSFNTHQRTLLFDPNKEEEFSLIKLIKLYKCKSTPQDTMLTFQDFHFIRFTYICKLFAYYRETDEKFVKILQDLPPQLIWNIYKQLSYSFLEKARETKYSEIQQNFKQAMMDKLKENINKIHSSNIISQEKNFEFSRDFTY